MVTNIKKLLRSAVRQDIKLSARQTESVILECGAIPDHLGAKVGRTQNFFLVVIILVVAVDVIVFRLLSSRSYLQDFVATTAAIVLNVAVVAIE